MFCCEEESAHAIEVVKIYSGLIFIWYREKFWNV